jgi:hypothetical protein
MAGPEQSPEVVVRKRILAVIDYLGFVGNLGVLNPAAPHFLPGKLATDRRRSMNWPPGIGDTGLV